MATSRMSPSVLDGFAVALLLLVVVAGALLLPATAWEPAVAALAAVVAAVFAPQSMLNHGGVVAASIAGLSADEAGREERRGL